jgi:hypothetical protein
MMFNTEVTSAHVPPLGTPSYFDASDDCPDLVAAALHALSLGLQPTPTKNKAPILAGWQNGGMTEAKARHLFTQADGIGIVCGGASGNLECLDFDMGGECLGPWTEIVEAESPGLLDRLPLEQTPSGGYHVPFRRLGPVPRNRKLAQRLVDGRPKELLETRATGGQFVTAPSPGYKWLQGGWDTIPTLTDAEADLLIRAAMALNEYVPAKEVRGQERPRKDVAGLLPGADFNARGDVLPYLERAGWSVCGQRGKNVFFTRPGKTSGISASLIDAEVFYCFSTNGHPFEPETGYSLFAVYALLEHDGDYNAAAKALYAEGFGGRVTPDEATSEAPGQDQETQQGGAFDLSAWESTRAFVGEPPVREYLVAGVFPRGQASLLAASGGVGKSYSLLALCRDVALSRGKELIPPRHFGGELKGAGKAVCIFAEDDSTEVHGRLNALGGPVEGLYAVPFPSVEGGAPLFFKTHPATKEPTVTEAWTSLVAQVRAIPGLTVLAIDPLQVFCALDLNQPENAQYVCSRISALAAETGTAVILSHHFRKDAADTPDEARQAVRGSAGLVDGVRAVVAMWVKTEGGAKDKTGGGAICKALGEVYAPEKVVQTAVVKANGKAVRGVTTFIRNDGGVLVDVSERVRGLAGNSEELADLLVEAVAEAARQGRPYKRTGDAGLFALRHELPEPFWVMSRARVEALTGELLRDKRIVTCQTGKTRGVLDIPGGDFAKGQGTFVDGAPEANTEEAPF